MPASTQKAIEDKRDHSAEGSDSESRYRDTGTRTRTGQTLVGTSRDGGAAGPGSRSTVALSDSKPSSRSTVAVSASRPTSGQTVGMPVRSDPRPSTSTTSTVPRQSQTVRGAQTLQSGMESMSLGTVPAQAPGRTQGTATQRTTQGLGSSGTTQAATQRGPTHHLQTLRNPGATTQLSGQGSSTQAGTTRTQNALGATQAGSTRAQGTIGATQAMGVDNKYTQPVLHRSQAGPSGTSSALTVAGRAQTSQQPGYAGQSQIMVPTGGAMTPAPPTQQRTGLTMVASEMRAMMDQLNAERARANDERAREDQERRTRDLLAQMESQGKSKETSKSEAHEIAMMKLELEKARIDAKRESDEARREWREDMRREDARREENRREDARRDELRREEIRREDARRDDARREDARRDDARRDEHRSDEARREDARDARQRNRSGGGVVVIDAYYPYYPPGPYF